MSNEQMSEFPALASFNNLDRFGINKLSSKCSRENGIITCRLFIINNIIVFVSNSVRGGERD